MIKSKMLRLLFVVCSVCLLFSCKDDDEKIDTNPAADIEGSYKGELKISLDGEVLDTSTQRISIIKETDTSIKLELKKFMLGSTDIGDIIVSGVKVELSNEQCFLKETRTTLTHADLGELDVTVSGSVSGDAATIHIKVIAGIQNIDVVFTGVKQVDADLAALVSGVYVGEFSYEKINSKAELTPYRQSFTITKINEDLVKIDMSNVAGLNPTFDAVEVNRVGNTVTFKETKELIVNGQKMTLEKMEMSGVGTSRSAMMKKAFAMVVRTSFNQVDQLRVTAIAAPTEKANEPFLNGITWTSDPEGVIVGDSKIVPDARKEIIQKVGDPNYGKVKYTGALTYYVLPGTTDEQKKQLAAKFLTTDDATYTVRSLVGSGFVDEADFSSWLMQCTVVAKDQLSFAEYSITCNEASFISTTKTYKFDSSMNWTEVDKKNADLNYFEPVDWATSNAGIYSIKSMLPGYYAKNKPYVVTKGPKEEAVGGTGLCAKLQTVMTNEQGTGTLVPKVTAGSLFLGVFETNMMDVLASTQFGMIYKGKKGVSSVVGKYKYKPGDKFWNNMVADNSGKQDKGSAVAVLYEVNKYTETLTGHDLTTSSKIVASAEFICVPTEEYTDFTLTLNYNGKVYDPAKKYKLAVVFSSSAEGDKYYGAAGSTLWIDNVTINVEK